MSQRIPHLTARLQGFGTTIFAQMSGLAAEHDAVNLGQGFPDFDPPEAVSEAAVAAIRDGHNQYAPGTGIPRLRHAIAAHQERFYGLSFDPDTEIAVTAGATEAMCATLQALCDTGDEVVVFEPIYDSYRAGIAMAGAVERVVPLRPPDFSFDPEELAAAITPKTRAIIVNSPHNPTGAVFPVEQLGQIAELCVAHDLIAITDEVYEHLVYTGAHVPLASLPGMRERTVLVSSAGKTFSVTGWKTGWICAAPALVDAICTAKQFMTYTNGTPFQHAVTTALGLGDDFYAGLADSYRGRRDRLTAGLSELGFEVFVPDGAYYVVADIRPLGFTDDAEFCQMLPAKVGVAAVPVSAFGANPRLPGPFVRFAFCKTDALLDAGLTRLAGLRSP